MNDREKLIELIEKWNKDEFAISYASDELADYLIANGVVVQKQGKWVLKETLVRSPFAKNAYCSECYEETPSLLNYCPNCGAFMRKGK